MGQLCVFLTSVDSGEGEPERKVETVLPGAPVPQTVMGFCSTALSQSVLENANKT
jgi:hypothetical protein